MNTNRVLITIIGANKYDSALYSYNNKSMVTNFHQNLLNEVNHYNEIVVFCTKKAHKVNYNQFVSSFKGKGVKINHVHISDGHNEMQYRKIIYKVIDSYIKKFNNKNISLDIDLTHGWRVQPIIVFNVFSLLQEILDSNIYYNNIRLNKVYYAAYFKTQKRGEIVDFSYINEIKKLTASLFLMNKTGISSELLHNLKIAMKPLTKLNIISSSDIKLLAYTLTNWERILTESNTFLLYNELKNIRRSLSKIKSKRYRVSHLFIKVILDEIFNQVDEAYNQIYKYKSKKPRIYDYHVYLASYALSKRNYLTCSIQITEGLKTWMVEHRYGSSSINKVFNLDIRDKIIDWYQRKRANNTLCNQAVRALNLYDGITNIRNPLSHGFTDSKSQPNKINKSLSNQLQKFKALGPPY